MNIGRYNIIKELGKGGMAVVYEAVDSQTGQNVALKVLNAEYVNDPDISKRFEYEAKVVMGLNHPNILKVFEYLSFDNQKVIVMELIKGPSMRKYVKQYGPLSEEKAVEYMMQILSAIDFVHKNGVIHRDLKPSNILINQYNQIKIIDFGIAKIVNGVSDIKTKVGSVIGTYMYMSPEQIRGKKLDNLSDIYSLGGVFYFMLTGKNPYTDLSSEYDVQDSVVKKPLPAVPYPDLDRIIQKATRKKPKDRFMTCDEFAQALVYRNEFKPFGADGPDEVYPLPGVVLSIGRSNKNNIVFPQSYVSRHHADLRIDVLNNEYEITDMNSASGTYVNGRKIKGTHRLSPGDKVKIADIDLPWEEYVQKIAEDISVSEENDIGNSNVTDGEALGWADMPDDYNTANNQKDLSWFQYYKKVMSEYSNFSGRARRKEYWSYIFFFVLFLVGLNVILVAISISTEDESFSQFAGLLILLYLTFNIIPLFSVSARRMHDTDNPAWVMFIPFYSNVLTFVEGTYGRNKYGEDPKAYMN